MQHPMTALKGGSKVITHLITKMKYLKEAEDDYHHHAEDDYHHHADGTLRGAIQMFHYSYGYNYETIITNYHRLSHHTTNRYYLNTLLT